MPLYDIKDIKQDPTGKALHWKSFSKFQESDLYKLFCNKINTMLKKDSIESRLAGTIIIEKLKATNEELISTQKNVSGLFGMTLWNVIAKRPEKWYFTTVEGDDRGYTSTNYWRKKSD